MIDALRSSTSLILMAMVVISVAALTLLLSADTTPSTVETRRLFGVWRLRYILLATVLVLLGLGLLLAAWSRELMLNFVMSVASIVMTITVLEGIGRVGIVSWPSLFSSSQGELDPLGAKAVPNIDLKGKTKQDIAFAWGIEHDPIPFHYKTDSLGYRNKTDRPSADIILLGDSILVGALVPIDEITSTRLEQALRLSVKQIALIGLSPQEQHELFWNANLDPAGKLVIQFIFEGNDLLDSRRFRETNASAPPANPQNGLLINEVWHLLTSATDPTARRRSTANKCQIGGQKFLFLWTSRSHVGVADEADRITADLDAFAAKVRSMGARYAVVFVPTKYRVLADLCKFGEGSDLLDSAANLTPLRDHMRKWSMESGTPLLDLTDPLIASSKRGDIPWFWGDTHWNSTGHAIAAAQIARWKAIENSP